jgi:hypothetical protein
VIELNLRLAGAAILLLAVGHVALPRLLGWRAEMAGLPVVSRQAHQLHYAFVMLVLGMLGTLALVFGAALLEPTRLGRVVAAGTTLFWLIRLLAQVGFVHRDVWRGRPVLTALHGAAVLLWAYLTLTFGSVLAVQLAG